MKKYIIFLLILFILISIGVIIFFIKPKQQNKQNSLLGGMGYYSEPTFTVCKPLKKGSCGYGKRQSIRTCIPHPKTLNGCIDTDGYQTFNPLVEDVNCNFPCTTDLMNIKGTYTDITPVDKTSRTNDKYKIGTNRLYDSFNGLDMTNYYISHYDTNNQNFLLKGKCVPGELENFYYKTYNCDKNSGVKRGKKGCIYTCGSDNQITRKLIKGSNPRSYPIENNNIVCRDKYNSNIYSQDYLPGKCYNTFEGASKNLKSLGKIYGTYSYYDINQLEEYSLDLSENAFISKIGKEEICTVRSICDGTSGIKNLNDNIITYGVSGVSTTSTILVYGGVSFANKFTFNYDSVTIRFKDNGTTFDEIDGSIQYGTSNGVCITYGYITTPGGSLVTSVLHNFYKGSDGVCRVNKDDTIEPTIFDNIGWGEYKLNYSQDFVNNTVTYYGLSCSGFVTKGIEFITKSYYDLTDDVYITKNTGVSYGSTGTCSLYSQNCFNLHIYGTPVSKKRYFPGTSPVNLPLDTYSGYYYPVSIIKNNERFTNDTNKYIYDISLSLKEYPGYIFYLSSSSKFNSSSYYTGPSHRTDFIKNDAYKVLGTAEVKFNFHNIYGDNIPYSHELVGRGYNCSSGIKVDNGIRIKVSELIDTKYTIVDHIRSNSYLSVIDKTDLIPTGYYFDLNERFNFYRSYSNKNYIISDEVNFVEKNIIQVYDSDLMKGAYKIDNLGNRENICYNDETNNIISNSKIVNYNPGEVIVVPVKSTDSLNVNLRKDATGTSFVKTILDYKCYPEVDINDLYPKQKDVNLQITDGCSVIDFGMSVENNFLQLGYSLTEVGCKKNTYCYPTFYTNNKNISTHFLEHQDIYEVKNKELYYQSIKDNNKLENFDSNSWKPISEYIPFVYVNKNSSHFRNDYSINITKPGVLISTPETYSIFKTNIIKTQKRDNIISNPFKTDGKDFSYNFTNKILDVQFRNKFDQPRYFSNNESKSNKSRNITTFFGNILQDSKIINANGNLTIKNFGLFNENYYYDDLKNLNISFPTVTNKIYTCDLSYTASSDGKLSLIITNPDNDLSTQLTNTNINNLEKNNKIINSVSYQEILNLNNKQENNYFLNNLWGIYEKSITKVNSSISFVLEDTTNLEEGMFILCNENFTEGTSIVNIDSGINTVILSYGSFINSLPGDTVIFVSNNNDTIGNQILNDELKNGLDDVVNDKILNNIYEIPFNINYEQDSNTYISVKGDTPSQNDYGSDFPVQYFPFIISRNINESRDLTTDNVLLNLININKQYYLEDINLYNKNLSCTIKDYFTDLNLISLGDFVKPNINFLSNLIFDLTVGRYIYGISEYVDLKTSLTETFDLTGPTYIEVNSTIKRKVSFNYTYSRSKNILSPNSSSYVKFGTVPFSETDNGISLYPILDTNSSFQINNTTDSRIIFKNNSSVVTLTLDPIFNSYDTDELQIGQNYNQTDYPAFLTNDADSTGLEIQILDTKEDNHRTTITNFKVVKRGTNYVSQSLIWFDFSNKYLFKVVEKKDEKYPGNNNLICSYQGVIGYDPSTSPAFKWSPKMYFSLLSDYKPNVTLSSFNYIKLNSYQYTEEINPLVQIINESSSGNSLIILEFEKNFIKKLDEGTLFIISTFDPVFLIDNGNNPGVPDNFNISGDEIIFNQIYNFSNKNLWYGVEKIPTDSSNTNVNLNVTYNKPSFNSSISQYLCGYFEYKNTNIKIPIKNEYYLLNLGLHGVKLGKRIVDDMGPKIQIDSLFFDKNEKYDLSSNNEFNYFYKTDDNVTTYKTELNIDNYIQEYNSGKKEFDVNRGFLSGIMEDYKYNVTLGVSISNSIKVPLTNFFSPNIIDVNSMIGMCTSAVELEVPSYCVLIPPKTFTRFKDEMIDFHDHTISDNISSKMFEVVKIYDKDDQNVYMERNYYDTENFQEYTIFELSGTRTNTHTLIDEVTTNIEVVDSDIDIKGGYLEISNIGGTSREIISYTGITKNLPYLNLNGVKRGLFNTDSLYHKDGSCVVNVNVNQDFMLWDLTNYNLFDKKYKITNLDIDDITFDIPFENISYETNTYLEDIYKGSLIVTEKNDGTKFLSSGISSSTGQYLIPNYTSFYGVSTFVDKTLSENSQTQSLGMSITNFVMGNNGVSLTFTDGTSITNLATGKIFYLDSYQSNNYGLLNFNESMNFVKENTTPINSNKIYPLKSEKSFIGYVYEISKKNEGGSFTNLGQTNILFNNSDIYKIKLIEDPNNRMYVRGNHLSMNSSRFYGTSNVILSIINVQEDGYVVSCGTCGINSFNLETKLDDVVLGDAFYDPSTYKIDYTIDTNSGTSYVKFYPTVELTYLTGKTLNFQNLIWSGGPYLEQDDTNDILEMILYNSRNNYINYNVYHTTNDYKFVYVEDDFAEYQFNYDTKLLKFDFNRNYNRDDYTKIIFNEKEYMTFNGSSFTRIPKSYNLENNSTSYYNSNIYYVSDIEVRGDDKQIYKSLQPNYNINLQNTSYWEKQNIIGKEPNFYDSSGGYMSFVLPDTKIETLKGMKDNFLENESNLAIKVFDSTNSKQYVPKMCLNYEDKNYQNLQNNLYIINLNLTSEYGISPFLTLSNTPCSFESTNPKIGSFSNCLGNPNDLFNEQYISMFNYGFVKDTDNICYTQQFEGISIYELSNSLTFMFSPVNNVGPSYYKISSYFGYNYLGKITFIEYDSTPGISLYPLVFSNYKNELLFDKNTGIQTGTDGTNGLCLYNYNRYEIFKISDLGDDKYSITGIPKNIIDGTEEGVSVCVMKYVDPNNNVRKSNSYKLNEIFLKKIGNTGVSYNSLYPVGGNEEDDNSYFSNDMDNYKLLRQNFTGHGSNTRNINTELVKCNYFFKFNKQLNDPLYVDKINFTVTYDIKNKKFNIQNNSENIDISISKFPINYYYTFDQTDQSNKERIKLVIKGTKNPIIELDNTPGTYDPDTNSIIGTCVHYYINNQEVLKKVYVNEFSKDFNSKYFKVNITSTSPGLCLFANLRGTEYYDLDITN